jgi:hypothetical protein
LQYRRPLSGIPVSRVARELAFARCYSSGNDAAAFRVFTIEPPELAPRTQGETDMKLHRALGPTAIAAVVGLGTQADPAQADELADLKAQVDVLQNKVRDLAQKQEAPEPKRADGAVTAGATPGSFKLPNSNTSVTLGGYVKLDAVYTDPSAGVDSASDLLLQPSSIPVGPAAGNNERKQVKLGARESRLFLRTSTPTAYGDLVTHFETDLYGADGNESVSNSHGLRLRHAYGSLGGLLAGQTWTNFMYVPALPETLDFGGPVGQIFDRQAQIRWTQPFAGTSALASGQWSIALENPESVVTLVDGTSFRADDDRVPDLTGQILFNTAVGKIALSALARQIRIDAKAPAVTDQAWGGALSVAGVVPSFGRDDFRFLVSAGNAIGRYSDGFLPDGIVGTDGRLHLPRHFGWYAAYRHFWSDRLRSSLVASGAGENNPAGAAAATNKGSQSLHANLVFSPVANTDLGLELIYANRETEDGAKGHVSRLQASAKYAF